MVTENTYINFRSSGQITRRIGATTYKVSVHFDDHSEETMQDKILRMVKNDMLMQSRTTGIAGGDSLAERRQSWYNDPATDEPGSLEGVQE